MQLQTGCDNRPKDEIKNRKIIWGSHPQINKIRVTDSDNQLCRIRRWRIWKVCSIPNLYLCRNKFIFCKCKVERPFEEKINEVHWIFSCTTLKFKNIFGVTLHFIFHRCPIIHLSLDRINQTKFGVCYTHLDILM